MRRLSTVIGTVIVLAACGGDDGSGPDGIRSVVVSAPFTTVRVGDAVQLTAAAYDGSGSVVPTATVGWTTSAPNLANVSTTGLVSGLAAGQAMITASAGGASGSLPITITPNPSGSALVSMPGNSFTPFTTTINVGGTVIYEFPSETHNVIFSRITGAPNDIQETRNQRVARTFPIAGTFPYECRLHPGMNGEVIVR